MSHVDEGRLHAYLDAQAGGAAGERAAATEWLALETHLEACADCRERLEQARRVRERTAAILSAAGPREIHMPPFAEIRKRAMGAGSRRPAIAIARYRALAWAATVVIAAGVGWYAGYRSQAGSRQDMVSFRQAAERADTAVVGAEPAAAAAGRQPALPPDADQAAFTRGLAQEDRARRREAAAPAEEAAVGAETRPAPPAAALPSRAVPAPAMNLAEAPEQKAPRTIDSVARLRRAPAAAELQAVVGGARVAQPDPTAGALAPADPGWRPVTKADAQRYLGAPVRRVARLSALSYEVGVVDDLPAVRVIQEVSPGVLLELIQRADRPEAEIVGAAIGRAGAQALADERDSLTAVATVMDGYRITARARLSVDSLLALLREIRP